jgi:hypothetical protein
MSIAASFPSVKKPRFNRSGEKRAITTEGDEGMTNGPPIFAYLVFGPGRVSLERLLRPIKATV